MLCYAFHFKTYRNIDVVNRFLKRKDKADFQSYSRALNPKGLPFHVGLQPSSLNFDPSLPKCAFDFSPFMVREKEEVSKIKPV